MRWKCSTTSFGTSRLAGSSAETAITAVRLPPSGNVRRWSAAINGESTSVFNETTLNWIVSAAGARSNGSDVFYFQPGGSRMLARDGAPSFGRLGGEETTRHPFPPRWADRGQTS